ncbi:MAG: hypothetical protein KatS3mg108_0798 [Isosphaeraceae bacterium]|jgi:uncharacterized protein (DUF2267 family)|nr:MAG: hypothetical protein KatS3mg108_0798 [Isosphaeraceae bacterium]
MSWTGLDAFDTTIHTTNAWLHAIMEELGLKDRRRAYHALRVVLHAARDRLTVSEAAHLGAQLPLLVRGLYYEGWQPTDRPIRGRRLREFVAPIQAAFRDRSDLEPETIALTVLRIIDERLAPGALHDVIRALPEELRYRWPAGAPL